MYDWNDLKYFLAAARAGSMGKAAARLDTSPSTVSRRLAALEHALGVSLFARTPEGLDPTPAGRELVITAEEAERAALRLQAQSVGLQGEPAGVVRVALTPDLEQSLVAPLLPGLFARWPRLRLECVGGMAVADLTRREADLAVRTVRPTTGESLVIRRLGPATLSIFASRRVLDQLSADPAEWPWIGFAGSEYPVNRWLSAYDARIEPIFASRAFGSMRRAAEAGVGVVMIPRVYGLASRVLVELEWPGAPLPALSLWLVGHSALRDSPRVRAVWDFLVDAFGSMNDLERAAARIRARNEWCDGWREAAD